MTPEEAQKFYNKAQRRINDPEFLKQMFKTVRKEVVGLYGSEPLVLEDEVLQDTLTLHTLIYSFGTKAASMDPRMFSDMALSGSIVGLAVEGSSFAECQCEDCRAEADKAVQAAKQFMHTTTHRNRNGGEP